LNHVGSRIVIDGANSEHSPSVCFLQSQQQFTPIRLRKPCAGTAHDWHSWSCFAEPLWRRFSHNTFSLKTLARRPDSSRHLGRTLALSTVRLCIGLVCFVH
jgi:hypothetical protein